MKNITIKRKLSAFILSCMLTGLTVSAQDNYTRTFQPDGICGKDALIGDCVPCGYDVTNFGNTEEMNSLAWTNGGSISNHRSLIEFDLSDIPAGSVVNSAHLFLYFNPTSANANALHSTTTGSNESYLQKVTSAWDESTINWNNQPGTDTTNRVYVPMSTSGTQDYDIDVASLIQDFVDNPSQNYGMMLGLLDESYYRCLLFASSDHPNSALHPKLVVNYTPPDSGCYNLQYASCNGIDALIGDCVPCGYDTSNFGDTEEINALAWTNGGSISNHRSLLYWNLGEIPSNSIVTSANLYLYFNPTSANAGGLHSSTTGPNEASIEKITAAWYENTVTWNNQPSTTAANAVPVHQSTSNTEDYIIDVTSLVQDFVANPNTNFGMMLKLNEESYYRCLLFASSDHPMENLHPKLEICYNSPNGINDIDKNSTLINVYPVPNNGSFGINFERPVSGILNITNSIGQNVYSEKLQTSITKQIKLDLAAGIYMIQVTEKNKSFIKKFIVQ